MRQILQSLALILLAVTLSCEESVFLKLCDECLEEEPMNTTLEFKVSKELLPLTIEIFVYAGNIEDGILIGYFDYAREYFTVAVNKKYTVVAKYGVRDQYFCVTSTTPRVKYYPDFCEEPCYYVTGRVVDLRLKYQ